MARCERGVARMKCGLPSPLRGGSILSLSKDRVGLLMEMLDANRSAERCRSDPTPSAPRIDPPLKGEGRSHTFTRPALRLSLKSENQQNPVNLFHPARDKADRSHKVAMTAASGQQSDRELVDRVAKGDRAAVRLLFMRHHARVYRFVARQTGSESMADDIANEVFLELWRQAPAFEGRSEVSTWLLGIARFKALSALRKRKEVWIDDDDAAAVPDTADTPEVAVMKDDKAAALRRMVNALPEEHRTVIDLAYYHAKSVAEIGEILSIPVATVKTRMFYARKKLGEALLAAGFERGWP